MQVLVDFFTFTSKVHSVENLTALFGLELDKMLPGKAMYGYYHSYCMEGVQVLYGGREEVCVNLSGKGCRLVESLNPDTWDWFAFMRSLECDVLSGDIHISRLDIACDEFDGILDYRTIVRYVQKKKYISKASKMPFWSDGSEQSIYFGASSSDRRLRIYNKALEQGIEDPAFHWMRCEFQFRNAAATSFFLNWLKVGNIGLCYSGVLIDYLRFITKPVTDGHYSRAVVTSWWKRFTSNASKIPQCYLQGKDYDFNTVYEFLAKQAGSSLKLLLERNNGDLSFVLDLVENSKLSQKQEQLLRSWRMASQ